MYFINPFFKGYAFKALNSPHLLTPYDEDQLFCDSFKEHRCNLLADVNAVLQNSGHSVWSNSFLQLLLYGDQSLSYEANRSILTLTITYILKTERLD